MAAAAIVYEFDTEGFRTKLTVPLVVGCHWILVATPTRMTPFLSAGVTKGFGPVGAGIAEVQAVVCGTEVYVA
jgi:hypothetical protein